MFTHSQVKSATPTKGVTLSVPATQKELRKKLASPNSNLQKDALLALQKIPLAEISPRTVDAVAILALDPEARMASGFARQCLIHFGARARRCAPLFLDELYSHSLTAEPIKKHAEFFEKLGNRDPLVIRELQKAARVRLQRQDFIATQLLGVTISKLSPTSFQEIVRDILASQFTPIQKRLLLYPHLGQCKLMSVFHQILAEANQDQPAKCSQGTHHLMVGATIEFLDSLVLHEKLLHQVPQLVAGYQQILTAQEEHYRRPAHSLLTLMSPKVERRLTAGF
jgi:hypothetical protein